MAKALNSTPHWSTMRHAWQLEVWNKSLWFTKNVLNNSGNRNTPNRWSSIDWWSAKVCNFSVWMSECSKYIWPFEKKRKFEKKRFRTYQRTIIDGKRETGRELERNNQCLRLYGGQWTCEMKYTDSNTNGFRTRIKRNKKEWKNKFTNKSHKICSRANTMAKRNRFRSFFFIFFLHFWWIKET